jgi:subtilisin family serine protease
VLAIVAAVGLAFAAPAYGAMAPAAAGSASQAAKVASQSTVTLITGDVVQLTKDTNGRQAATVRPPSDRLQVGYSTQQVGQDVYVVPNDAVPLLAAGTLSRDVFDVSKLVADGYGDARSAATPLIVQYSSGRTRAQSAPALPGTSRTATLGSINANSVRQNKRQAHAFWTALAGDRATGARPSVSGVKRIWLDAKVQVDLHESVPMIGAPQAWAAGFNGTGVNVAVLDTGILASHPDFAGKIVASQNFVPAGEPGGGDPADVTDRFGHGTHVASIVAGTGAADNGYYIGVAPGAGLIIGKVLNDGGSGQDSTIIAGMQWATETEHARIVSMSLGSSSPSDGTDPLSQAVDDLTAQTGALFVIAAGNAGPNAQTVASPGAADAALTVGAVDKSDQLASFSSRGPRLGDYEIKPDIAAPGVGIVAARAPGTPVGDQDPVDNFYTRLSGTSMATPHVAGAAAILAQEHPDWTAAQLKPALVSTSKDDGYTVYQQGGGRVDVARAFSQQVYADPGTLSLGYFRFPHTGQQPVTKPVTFRNNGTTDVTLSLSLNVTGQKTGAAPAAMFTLSQPSVTVPAGRSASVKVTVDPSAGPDDLYSGYLTATSGSIVTRTAVGAYVEGEMYNVTVPAIAHDGRQAAGISQVELYNPGLPGVFQTQYYSGGNVPVFRVPPGTYSLMGYIFTMDAPNLYALAATVVGKPELTVTADTTVTLDARPAHKITVNTPKPSAPSFITVGYNRSLAPNSSFSSSFSFGSPTDQAYAVSTPPVTTGSFEFYSQWALEDPPIQMSVTKPANMPLDPQFMINAAPVNGTFRQPLVYVGLGAPSDYAGKDLHGKIALIQRGTYLFVDKIKNAEDAGAAAAIIFNNRPGLLLAAAGASPGSVTIPAFTINQDVGLGLVNLLQSGPVTVQY